ncbi:transcription initiation factor IIA subunit 1-like [Suricata suricatta]|uniref:transcription initiation factor IIA subunit 1-like n=1 Tax=Suricata suricatta TaxID=37032 RepID=UPI0011564635|nr:transcription initiation factor IIA subunit 1-like [Suricata suricatta]
MVSMCNGSAGRGGGRGGAPRARDGGGGAGGGAGGAGQAAKAVGPGRARGPGPRPRPPGGRKGGKPPLPPENGSGRPGSRRAPGAASEQKPRLGNWASPQDPPWSTSVRWKPKLYRSVIEDVINDVRDIFLDDGVDEQVLMELKTLWENKLMQSRAVDGFHSEEQQLLLQVQQQHQPQQQQHHHHHHHQQTQPQQTVPQQAQTQQVLIPASQQGETGDLLLLTTCN